MDYKAKWLLFGCLSMSRVLCETATPARRVADTVGVNVHLGFYGTLYKSNFPLVLSSLKELGITHVRDGLVDIPWTGDSYYNNHKTLASAGIKCDFITSISQTSQLLQQYPSRVLDMEAIEAPNEYDASGNPSWASDLTNYLSVLYTAVRSDPAMSQVQIIGPSLVDQNWWQTNNSYVQLGSVGSLFSMANLHNYQGGRNPGTPGWTPEGYGSIVWALSNSTGVWPSNPVMTTEIGYYNDATLGGSVPESVSAAYMPRVILEQFLHGIKRTYLYELADDQYSGGSYGLLHSDGSPKAAYAALKSLHTLLADQSLPGQLVNLNFSLGGSISNVHHLLVQKSTGSLLLLLWIELPRYDVNSKLATPVARQGITLSLPSSSKTTYTSEIQEDGTLKISKAPSQNGQLQININDRVMAIQIIP